MQATSKPVRKSQCSGELTQLKRQFDQTGRSLANRPLVASGRCCHSAGEPERPRAVWICSSMNFGFGHFAVARPAASNGSNWPTAGLRISRSYDRLGTDSRHPVSRVAHSLHHEGQAVDDVVPSVND